MLNTLRNRFIGNYLEKTPGFHKKSRITLLFNIAALVFIAGGAVSITAVILGTYAVLIPSGGNILLAGIALLLLKQEKVELAAKVYFIALFMLLFGNLNFNYEVMHIGSPFWVILLNILVIYILGIRWGLVFLTASTFGFVYYVVWVLPMSIEIAKTLPSTVYYTVIYETVIVMFLLGYIISTILKASRESDTLLVAQNEELRRGYEEKTVMLKEIHHRVKNNLQVIISLMRLKMIELNNKEAVIHYQDTINRVIAMSMIHEKIYQSEEISNVDMEEYFQDLAKDLLNTYSTNKTVQFNNTIQIEKMELDYIVPMALIFNEMFSNSLEHAFDVVEHPEISVYLTAVNKHQFEFRYEDNGIWVEPKENSSFGLELIDTLVDQMDGALTFTHHPTRYLIQIGAN